MSGSAPPSTPKGTARWMGRIRALVRAGLIAVFCSSLLSYSVGDSFRLSAVVTYATPWLIRLAVAVVALAILRRNLWWLSVFLLLTALYDANESFRSGSGIHQAVPGSLTISTWNAGRELDNLKSEWHFESDVVGIIESGQFDPDEWRDFQKATPAYRWLRFDGGTMLGVRGKYASFESLGEHDLFRCFRVKVQVDSLPSFMVVVVDMRSQPWLSREEPMRRIFEAVKPGEPAVVLGDFNTPPDSRWIRINTFRNWSLANRSQSQGFIETWPHGLPLHCLDQIWVSGEFQTLDFKQQVRPSDHRLVEARLQWQK